MNERRSDEQTNKRTNERTNKRTKERQNERTNVGATNERTSARTNERTSEQRTNFGTNKRTKRTNFGTNKRTNEQTNERTSPTLTHSLTDCVSPTVIHTYNTYIVTAVLITIQYGFRVVSNAWQGGAYHPEVSASTATLLRHYHIHRPGCLGLQKSLHVYVHSECAPNAFKAYQSLLVQACRVLHAIVVSGYNKFPVS